MASPLTDFETNFRSAETLLKVYRLLETPDGPATQHALMQGIRDLLMAGENEVIMLLVNDQFLGAIRENANVLPTIFRRDNLAMLLRQAIVAGCTAIDVYYPALLRAHLPRVIAVKQRNFLPTDRNTRDFLKEFHLSLEDCLRMLSDPQPEQVLGDLFVEHLKRKTLSNTQGVAVALQILGVEDPWNAVASRVGEPATNLQRQFEALVNRRNDIVHRGDRSARDLTGAVQDINYSWVDNHIHAAHSVVFASNELVETQVATLPALVSSVTQAPNG